MRKKRYVVKQRSRMILRIGILALGALLAIGLVFGLIHLLKSTKKGAKELTELPFTDTANYTYTGSGFLYFQEGKLYYMDIADGRKDTSYKINTDELKLTASPGISVLYHDTAVQIVGSEAPIVVSGKVLGVKCSQAHVAVLREDSAGKTAIVIYDGAGTQTDQMDFDAADLIDFGFSNRQDETLWTLKMDLSASTPVCTITTYNLATKRTTGVINVQNQLTGDVIFTDKSLFLSGTSDLIRYTLAGSSEVYRISVYGWKLADSSIGESPILLYKQRGGSNSILKLYTVPEGDVGSAAISTVHPPEGALAEFLIKGKLMIYTPTAAYTYSAAGKLLSRDDLPIEIDGAKKLSDNHIMLSREGKLYISVTK